MNPEEFFRKLKHMVGHKHKVVKTIKPTEEEVSQYMTLVGYQKAAEKAVGTHESMKKLFWAKVELRTGEVNRSLVWNDKKQTIEVMDCDHESELDGEISLGEDGFVD